MQSIRHRIATSNTPGAKLLRRAYRGLVQFSLPAPGPLSQPLVLAYTVISRTYYWIARTLVCEPLFKAQCTTVGKGTRTGPFIHWFQGEGVLVVGERVELQGCSSFAFSNRLAVKPTLTIGSDTYIGHGCNISVARAVTIGEHCLLANDVRILDFHGHPLNPERRLAGEPVDEGDILPVTIGSNVWIGTGALIMPGVVIGDHSVVAARAVVTTSVPERVVAAGVPARVVRNLPPAEPQPPTD